MAGLTMESGAITTSQVLDRLSPLISNQEIPGVLGKILRVPQAWEAMHNVSVLESICQLIATKPLTPALVAAVSMDMDELPSAEESMPDEVEAELEQVWQRAQSEKTPPENIYQTALLSIALYRESQRSGAADDIARWALDHPLVWRSALACNWFAEPLQSEFIRLWLTEGIRGFSLAAWVLSANYSPAEVSRLLINIGSHSPGQLMQRSLQVGETHLAASLSRLIEQGVAPSRPHSVDSLIADAMGSIAHGSGENAKSTLGAAWEMTSKLAGSVAEWIAITAEQNNEPVVAIEAWNRALDIQSTPNRRARLALCYHNLGRTDEALDTIAADSNAPEELIAAGIIQAEHTQEPASQCLMKAVRAIRDDTPPQPAWMLMLIDALTRLGETKTALSIVELLTDVHPPIPDLYTHVGEVYLLAEDTEQAAAAGQTAIALAPDHEAAQVLLARSYGLADDHRTAIQIWEKIVENNPQYRLDLAAASLMAEEPEKALRIALEILEEEPHSIEPKSIVGDALIQMDKPNEALQYLQEAAASAPDSPQAWLALSNCQNALGQYEAEQQTIQSGLEAVPDSAELHYRIAQILLENNQLDEARHHIEKSVEGDNPPAACFALKAKFLTQLDKPQDALLAYEEAFRRQPNNWVYRVDLASAYADQDRTGKAVQLLQALPQSAGTQAHSLAARVFSAYALDDHDEYLEQALDRLDTARQSTGTDSWLTLQQARILEKLDRLGPAFFAYRQYVNLAQEQKDGFLLEGILGAARTALETDQAVVAIAMLEQGQETFPESPEPLKMLAPAYIRAGMNQRALAVARQAVDLLPGDPTLLKLLSQAAAQNQNWDEAIESLEQIIADGADNAETWIAIADVSISAERVNKARVAIAHVLQQDGRNDAGILQQAASLLERLDLHHFALLLLKRAFHEQDDNLELASRLGELGQKMGDLEVAQIAWLCAAELAPTQIEYLDQAASVSWLLGRRSSAIGHWQRAAAIEPDNASLQLRLARALLENGEVEKSLDHFQQSLALDPDNLELLMETGQVHSQYGSPQNAISIYTQALTHDPEAVEAKLGLARCHLQLNAPDLAREIIEDILEAAEQKQVQSQAYAMLALSALQMGDLPVAARSFQNAKSIGEVNGDQELWLSRTALRMGRWDDALEILDRDQSTPTPELVKEQLTCRLRIEDARYLYEDLAAAHQHAPTVVENHNRGQISELVSWLETNISFAPWLDETRTWFSIQQEDVDPTTSIDVMVDALSKSELVHALAIRLIRSQQYEKALQLLEQCEMSFDTDLWGILLRGICQLQLDKPVLARETLQSAAGNPVISPIASYFIARCWSVEDEVAQAITSLNTAVSAWPDEAKWHHELAQLYLDNDRTDAALPHFQRAAEIEPKNRVFTLAYARCLRDAGHMQDAQAAYAHLIKLGDPEADVLREAGLAALANGDPEHAQHWLSEVAALEPTDAKSLMGAARAANRLGNKTRAHELSQAAYRLSPNDAQVLTGMAEIEAGRGKLEHALEYFDRALEACGDQPDIYIARSKLLLENKRPHEAIEALEKAAKLNPDDDQVLSLLAAAYEDLGKYDQAMTVASRAHTIAPLRPIHRLQLGRISRKAGQLDRAVDELSRAEQDHPADPAFPLELGKAYEARAEHKRALESYRRSMSLNPTLAEPHYRAGVLMKSQKAYAQACQMFERAAELDPNDADILHQLAAVRALSLVHGGIPKSVVST